MASIGPNVASTSYLATAESAESQNTLLASSQEKVEELLAKFYGRFPWPWPAKTFSSLEDLEFEIALLNQGLGDWKHQTIPKHPVIWVAGCGTNQAVMVALRYPTATVIGSDLSEKSLEICLQTAKSVGADNLILKQESINAAGYQQQFDFVISTGVIHHNAEPQTTLSKISEALKPGGILELMVYNRYHRIATSGFQRAVRIFGESSFEAELSIANKLLDPPLVKEVLKKAFTQFMGYSESDLADLLINPVEHSYTVESLDQIARPTGLEILCPCDSQYAMAMTPQSWNIKFSDPELQAKYDALPDIKRWQVTNLLLQEHSPFIWFYLQRTDGALPRKSERQTCEEFLDTAFEKKETRQRIWIRNEHGGYNQLPRTLPYPKGIPGDDLYKLYEAANPSIPMRKVFAKVGIDQSFYNVNQARMKLTTSAFPFLTACNR